MITILVMGILILVCVGGVSGQPNFNNKHVSFKSFRSSLSRLQVHKNSIVGSSFSNSENVGSSDLQVVHEITHINLS